MALRHPVYALCASVAAAAVAADPCPSQRIPPPEVVPAVGFGGLVNVDGNFWFVTDRQARVLCGGSFGCNAGAVHVYEMVAGQLEYRQMLTSPTPSIFDFYGPAAAHDGRLVVGAQDLRWPGIEAKGGGLVYEYDGTAWVQTGALRPPAGVDPRLVDRLGENVDIYGDVALIRPLGPAVVVAYAFDGEAWEVLQVIEPFDGLPRAAAFGFFTSMSDEWVFVSAYQDDTLTPFGGSVYAYRRQPDGSLAFTQKIVPTDVPAGVAATQGFGFGLSFDGRTLAIGARGASRPHQSTGAILLYEWEDGAWRYQDEVVHEDAQEGDQLSYGITIRGSMLLASAEGQPSSPKVPTSLHVFRRDATGVWRPGERLIPDPPVFAGAFASSIALSGTHLLAGAGNDADGSGDFPGAAYLFDLSCGACSPDLDLDGTLTIFDFLTYLNLFQDGDATADFDGDGELTIYDFLAFQTAFDAGC